jgi:hypothetical protein
MDSQDTESSISYKKIPSVTMVTLSGSRKAKVLTGGRTR